MFNCDECGMKLRVTPRKQKREVYIPVERQPYYTATEIRMMVQCKTTVPTQEKRY